MVGVIYKNLSLILMSVYVHFLLKYVYQIKFQHNFIINIVEEVFLIGILDTNDFVGVVTYTIIWSTHVMFLFLIFFSLKRLIYRHFFHYHARICNKCIFIYFNKYTQNLIKSTCIRFEEHTRGRSIDDVLHYLTLSMFMFVLCGFYF